MPVQEFLFTVDPRTDKNLSSINEQLRSLTNREDPLTLDNFISFDVIGYSGLRSVVIRVTMEVNAFYARTTFPVNGAAFSETAAPQAIKIVFNSKVDEGSITGTSIKYNGINVAASNIVLESDGYTLSVSTSSLSHDALKTHTIELISLRDRKGNGLSKQDVFSYVVGTSGSATSDRGNPEPYTYNDKVGDFKVTSFVIDRYAKIADKITEYLKTNNIDRESVIAQDILNVNEHTLEVYILYFSDLFPSVIRTFPQEGALVSSDGVPTEAVITFSQPTHINITEANNITLDGVDLSASGTLSDDNRTLRVNVSGKVTDGSHFLKIENLYNELGRVRPNPPIAIGFTAADIADNGGTGGGGGGAVSGITGIVPDIGTQIDGTNNPLITMSGGDAFISVSGVSASEIAINFDETQITFPPDHVSTSIFDNPGIVISDGDGTTTITGTANNYVSGVTLTGDNLVADVTILPGATGNLQVSHQSIPNASAIDNNGTTVVQDILVDSFGHVTGSTNYTITPSEIGAVDTSVFGSPGVVISDGVGDITITGNTDTYVSDIAISGAQIQNTTFAVGTTGTVTVTGIAQDVVIDLPGDLSTINTNISTNSSNISANSSSIATNSSNISSNSSNIAINISDIADNVTNIASNSSNIATNSSAIASNDTDITNIINSLASSTGAAVLYIASGDGVSKFDNDAGYITTHYTVSPVAEDQDNALNNKFVKSIFFDTTGHVTGIASVQPTPASIGLTAGTGITLNGNTLDGDPISLTGTQIQDVTFDAGGTGAFEVTGIAQGVVANLETDLAAKATGTDVDQNTQDIATNSGDILDRATGTDFNALSGQFNTFTGGLNSGGFLRTDGAGAVNEIVATGTYYDSGKVDAISGALSGEITDATGQLYTTITGQNISVTYSNDTVTGDATFTISDGLKLTGLATGITAGDLVAVESNGKISNDIVSGATITGAVLNADYVLSPASTTNIEIADQSIPTGKLSGIGSAITANFADLATANHTHNLSDLNNDNGFLKSGDFGSEGLLKAEGDGTFTVTSDVTAYIGTETITNDQLSGNIANSKLQNSSVSISYTNGDTVTGSTSFNLGGTIEITGLATGTTVGKVVAVESTDKIANSLVSGATITGDILSSDYDLTPGSTTNIELADGSIDTSKIDGAGTAITANHADFLATSTFNSASNTKIVKSDGAGSVTFITDSSTNWNTAYDWGDHGSAGYGTGSHVDTISGLFNGHSGDSSIHFALVDTVEDGDTSRAVTPNAVYDHVHTISGHLAGAAGSTTFTGLTDTPDSIVDGTFYYGSGSNLTGLATGTNNQRAFIQQGSDGFPVWSDSVASASESIIGVDTSNLATGAQLSWNGTKFVTTTGSSDLGGVNVQFLSTGGTIEYRRMYASDIFTTGFYGPGAVVFPDGIRPITYSDDGVPITAGGAHGTILATNSTSQSYYETDYIYVGDIDITNIELGVALQGMDATVTSTYKIYAVEVENAVTTTGLIHESEIVYGPTDDGVLKFATHNSTSAANLLNLKSPRIFTVFEDHNTPNGGITDVGQGLIQALSIEVEYTLNDVVGGGGGLETPRGSPARTIAPYYQRTLSDVYFDKTATSATTISGDIVLASNKTLTLDYTTAAGSTAINKQIMVDYVTSEIASEINTATSTLYTTLSNEIDTDIAAINLNDLNDVTISSVADGQVLKYSSSSSKWINDTDATGSGGGGGSTDLSPAEAFAWFVS